MISHFVAEAPKHPMFDLLHRHLQVRAEQPEDVAEPGDLIQRLLEPTTKEAETTAEADAGGSDALIYFDLFIH